MAHLLNAGDTPCEIVEVISPAGFEQYFRELAELLSAQTGASAESLAELRRRYSLEMEPGSVPGLCERFGLTHPLARG